MIKLAGYINRRTRFFGIDLDKLKKSIKGIFYYFRTYKKLKKQKGRDSEFVLKRNYPILYERYEAGGIASGHYFHQDMYVAKKIFEDQPEKHVDIGSRVDGFVSHVAVFREIEVFDIRDIRNRVPNIIFRKLDMMNIPEAMHDYCDSISALHSIEHFGLGRYGDPIDYSGHIKGLQNITRILKQGGKFYFSVPVGRQRIEFNAQRVFSMRYLLDLLEKDYILESFSYVDDKGDFHEGPSMEEQDLDQNFGCNYGCGIFELIKR